MKYVCSKCDEVFCDEESCKAHERNCARTYRSVMAICGEQIGGGGPIPKVQSEIKTYKSPSLFISEDKLEKLETYKNGYTGYTIELWSEDLSPEKEKEMKVRVFTAMLKLLLRDMSKLNRNILYFFTEVQKITTSLNEIEDTLKDMNAKTE